MTGGADSRENGGPAVAGNGAGAKRGAPPRRRQATPIELAAILMEAVCQADSSQEDVVQHFGDLFGARSERLQAELMFLRAFAVDFATVMTLGDSAEKQAILARYYRHWERVATEVDDDVLSDLHEHLQFYQDTICSPSGADGLGGQVGRAFATLCRVGEEGEEEVAVLGGSLFAALFEEVCDLLTTIDILLVDADPEES